MVHRGFAALVFLAIVAAACGTDDTDSSESSAATAASADDGGTTTRPLVTGDSNAPLTASARGVTAETITIGLSMLDFDQLVELELVDAGWGDQELVFDALVEELNDRGGILGRRVEVVYASYSPISAIDADAACLRLTEDAETFAVLGGFLGPVQAVNDCIVSANDTVLVGGVLDAAIIDRSDAPWIDFQPGLDARIEPFVELLSRHGDLDGAVVAVLGTADDPDLVDRGANTLEDEGVTVEMRVELNAGVGDLSAVDREWDAVAERLRLSDVDTVFIVTGTPGALRAIDRNDLGVEVWALNDAAVIGRGSGTPKETADGVISMTSLTEQEAWEDPTTQPCKDAVVQRNPDIDLRGPAELQENDDQWFKSVLNLCRWLRLFELVATAAGPDLTQETLSDAIETYGEMELPGVPFGSLGPGKFYAGDAYRLSVFNSDEGDKGGFVALTEIEDVAG